MNSLVPSILFGVIGIVLGIVIMLVISKSGVSKAKAQAKLVQDEAKAQAENALRQATLDGKQQAYEYKLQAEKEIQEQKKALTDNENKLLRREDNLNFRDETLTQKEKQLEVKTQQVTDKLANLDKMEQDLQNHINNQIQVLEQAAHMSVDQAKTELMNAVERKMDTEIATYIRDREEQAETEAAEKSRNIMALAMQRYAQEETLERTVSVVTLPNDDMKGRIIGREGRNIRAIEQATGVDLIVDDTPEVITVSCFNPIRREIARQTLEAAIKDGRIQVARIEELVQKFTKEIDENIRKFGEDTLYKMNVGKMDKELVRLLGTLRYRYSYGQNCLQHSMEVATFAGIMAVELGLNQTLAKRAGLLHDIGKAMDFEQEGTHMELGAKIAKKCGENPVVINAIESHHGGVPADSVIAVLVAAADALSAARPGARYESMENYIERLEQLEKIATSFEGVDKAYAIQAGREVRVMVVPEKVDDVRMNKVAFDIKEKVQNEMKYPGQVTITLIREVRVQEIAK